MASYNAFRYAVMAGGLLSLHAQDPLDIRAEPEASRGGWSVLLGAQVMAIPAFEGSDKLRVLPYPVFSATYDGRYYLGSSRVGVGFGGGIHLVRAKGFTWDFGLGVGDRRPEDRADILAGMGDRQASLWMGTGLHWRHQGFRVGLSLAHGLRDEAGNRASVSLGHTVQLTPRWTFSAGVQAAWSDQQNMQYDFGIDAEQASRRAALMAAGDPRLEASRVGPFTPAAGLRSLGASVAFGFQPAHAWHVSLSIRGGALQGDAKVSPLTTRESYVYAGFGFAHHF